MYVQTEDVETYHSERVGFSAIKSIPEPIFVEITVTF